ncbi:hypothetical protein EVAR_93850_1 [Eumeta japonica]|uniref:Endonuclease/exonuclease/phosphatase domain-containing protein n=1 Tax=Eumeta variegata TaxID=151549 RepID=A0A4C1TWQ3_EUMVA|nr:hypothetical protein EVAR_93850_1 [Eumeta japonica]
MWLQHEEAPALLTQRLEARIKIRSKDLQVSKPEPAFPLIIIQNVFKINSDQDIVDSLKRQNGHVTESLDWEKVEARVRYRKKPSGVLFGFRGVACAIHPPHKSRSHLCGAAAKTCVGLIAPSAVLALPWVRPQYPKPYSPADDLLTGKTLATHLCGSSNSTCSKISLLLRNCWLRVIQRMVLRIGSVKATIIILDSGVDVKEDQTLIDENVTAAVIIDGNYRIGIVSMYLEGEKPIGSYLGRVKWGSERDEARGAELCDFSDMEGLHVLNEGNISMFEVYRGDCLFQSAIDVTVCSFPLMDRAEEWEVVRDVTYLDHNAVTFNIHTEGRLSPGPFHGKRIYNTTKDRWSEFLTAFDSTKEERALTVEMMEAVDLCDQLDGVVGLYTECVQRACDAAIRRKRSTRKSLVKTGARGAEKKCEH